MSTPIRMEEPEYITVGDLKKILANLEDKDHMLVMIAIDDQAHVLTDVLTKVHQPVWFDGMNKTLKPLGDVLLGSQRTVVLQGRTT